MPNKAMSWHQLVYVYAIMTCFTVSVALGLTFRVNADIAICRLRVNSFGHKVDLDASGTIGALTGF